MPLPEKPPLNYPSWSDMLRDVRLAAPATKNDLVQIRQAGHDFRLAELKAKVLDEVREGCKNILDNYDRAAVGIFSPDYVLEELARYIRRALDLHR